MALIDLTTDLKSLRYGKDRVGGGSSKEPFVTDSINSSPGDTGGPDFLLRANTLQHVGDDLSRMGKFMISPKGLQFAAKQNVLSRSGVRVQSNSDINFNPINDGIYLPTSTLAQVAVNATGGHLLKQGINPFRNTKPDNANTGIGFIDSILNAELPLSQPMYSQRVKNDQTQSENRLVQLVESKIGIARSSGNNPVDSFLGSIFEDRIIDNLPVRPTFGEVAGGIFNNLLKPPFGKTNSNDGLNISPNDNEILRYNGGPGSALGIGQTAIDRVVDSQAYTENRNFSKYNYLLNYSNIIGKTGDGVYSTSTPKGTTMVDFRSNLIFAQKDGINKDVLSTSLNYTDPKERLGGRVNMGDPGRKGRNLINYSIGVQEGGKPTGPLDKINALPLYQKPEVMGDTPTINDLVKFRIGILDNNSETNNKTYIHFRSFIDSFSDNYSAEWKNHQYMGRGESFYSYGGFKRQISMAWTVAALSIDELIPMYQKLNFLASSLAPDYSSEGYMQGNIAYLTMGGYCYEQPGIITGMTISPMKESPYEINLNSTGGVEQGRGDGGKKTKELAMYVNVTGFNFIPIHNFVPRIQKNTYFGAITEGGGGKYVSKFGKERFIALKNAVNNNYTQNNFTRPQPKENNNGDNQQVNKTEQSQGLNNSTE